MHGISFFDFPPIINYQQNSNEILLFLAFFGIYINGPQLEINCCKLLQGALKNSL